MKKSGLMKPEEDALGQEIRAYYNDREVFEVWERDDGYISVSTIEPKKYFSEYEDWSPHEKRAMEFVKGRALDVGCGAGRHSLYLQKKGFDVLGIDRSPLAISICKLRGVKKAKVMSVEDVDFKPNSFDTIVMMGNNFSLFASFKRARKLLKRFRRMTTENALIIAETRDPYKTDNPAYSEYYKLNRRRGRMSGQIRGRVRFEKYVSKWFDWLMVSKEEMEKILNGTGWKVKKFIDSGDSQYVAIIEKAT
jgi:SAM-dependent methyltransferase